MPSAALRQADIFRGIRSGRKKPEALGDYRDFRMSRSTAMSGLRSIGEGSTSQGEFWES